MSASKIEWTEKTWNPVRGCSLVSAGCKNCYAMKQAHRFSRKGQAYEGLTELGPDGPRWTGKVMVVGEHLMDPYRWSRPSKVFVNSMSDLFHEDIPVSDLAYIFEVMRRTPQHAYQILTKRPERMLRWMKVERFKYLDLAPILPNVWLGVSVEDQKTADERIPLLLQTPAAVRWVSYEPALGPVDFKPYMPPSGIWEALKNKNKHWAKSQIQRTIQNNWRWVDWIVVGGESGPGARPFDIAWARSTVEQCKAAGVPVFVKQMGNNLRISAVASVKLRNKGGDPAEWPEDLRVREYPSNHHA